MSRGAHKLIGALDAFPLVVVEGRDCLDAGASTGGFTQVLLERGAARVLAVATTQEEIGYSGGGARVAAYAADAQMAIAVDVTFATDHPGAKKEEVGEHTIGGGPVLTRGSVIHPTVFTLLRDTAESLSMPYSVHAAGRFTSTDADAMQLARGGVATGLVSIPNRYMHSPNEMVSLADLDRAADLIAETCRRVTGTTDFTDR